MRAVYPDQVQSAMQYGVYDPRDVPITIAPYGSAIQLPPGSTLYLTQDGPVIIDAQGKNVSLTDYPEIISGNRYFRRLSGNITMNFQIHPYIFLVTATQTIRLSIPDIIPE